MTADRRYWITENGKRVRVPGVTTVIRQIGWSSGGLMYWANQAGLDGLTLEEARETATTVGTIVHALIEADARGHEPKPYDATDDQHEQIQSSMDAWRQWKAHNRFEVAASERKLESATYRCGGRLDMAMVQGELGLMDYKTSAAVYPDHLVQLAAYGLLWDEACPDHPIKRYHLIRLSKDDGSFHHHSWPAAAMADAAEAFLMARRLYDLEKTLKGRL